MHLGRIGQQEGAGTGGGVVQQRQHALLVFPRERLNALAGPAGNFGGFFPRQRIVVSRQHREHEAVTHGNRRVTFQRSTLLLQEGWRLPVTTGRLG